MLDNPIYRHYISRFQDKTVQSVLVERINIVKRILEIVSVMDKWSYRYADDKWTLKQMVQHCIDCERIFSYRALHLVREDNHPLFGFDENKYAEKAAAVNKSGEVLIIEYVMLMESIRLMFDGFDEKDLNRKGRIAENKITVEEIGFVIAGHSLHHMDVILERYLD